MAGPSTPPPLRTGFAGYESRPRYDPNAEPEPINPNRLAAEKPYFATPYPEVI